jgi:hypothetical protein
MADTRIATVGIWHLRAEDIAEFRTDAGGLYLRIGETVMIATGYSDGDAGLEAAGLRALAEAAGRQAGQLEGLAALRGSADE